MPKFVGVVRRSNRARLAGRTPEQLEAARLREDQRDAEFNALIQARTVEIDVDALPPEPEDLLDFVASVACR